VGQGDKPKQFEPKYKPIRDDVLGKSFAPCCMRSCPEPHVIKRYGTGGQANVSVYVCRKCRYHEDMKWFGGVKCGYEVK
jgi:hypothetical protein